MPENAAKPKREQPLTVAEQSCPKAGYCVFTLGADRCSICGRNRNGERNAR